MSSLTSTLRSLVCSEHFLAHLNTDTLVELLDARESHPFDAEWMRVHTMVIERKLAPSPSVDSLRELSFKRALAITKSDEAAGYISDDIGLVADAVRGAVSDPWLSALVASYASGMFPHGELSRDLRAISDILGEF